MWLSDKWNSLSSKTKKIGLIVAASLLALFAAYSAGRLAAPTKIVEKEKIVKVVDEEAIKTAVNAARTEWEKNQTHQTVTHNIYQDGVIIESTVVDTVATHESTNTTTIETNTEATHTNTSTTTEKEKIVVKDKPRLHLGVNVGAQWNNLPTELSAGALTWEGHGEVRIVGDVWAGATVVPQLKFAGVGVSVQF